MQLTEMSSRQTKKRTTFHHQIYHPEARAEAHREVMKARLEAHLEVMEARLEAHLEARTEAHREAMEARLEEMAVHHTEVHPTEVPGDQEMEMGDNSVIPCTIHHTSACMGGSNRK